MSRPLVTEAYAQLAAEGYLALRQGTAARVADAAPRAPRPDLPAEDEGKTELRYDFRPGSPDLTSFPSRDWMKSVEAGLKEMKPRDFGYANRLGAWPLRQALAEYLGRVRGVSADPRQIIVTSGFEQALPLVARALRARGVDYLALEDPGYPNREAWLSAGLNLLPVAVDEDGLDVSALAESPKARAVLVTPAHQWPTGVVMSGARRVALVGWLREAEAIAIEDDYDAEFRYDRAPIGALQGLAPQSVIYAGTTSKTLAPALRLGWLVVPGEWLNAIEQEHLRTDFGRGRMEQFALAHFIRTGAYDRHLRKMRAVYAERREALLAALDDELPQGLVTGVSAGLHVTVSLPHQVDEIAVIEACARREVAVGFLRRHYLRERQINSMLLLSYANMSASSLRLAVRVVAGVLSVTTPSDGLEGRQSPSTRAVGASRA